MQRIKAPTSLAAVPRLAFTLLELIVVVFIVAILVALSTSAVMKYMGSQLRSNTQATLNRTQAQLFKQWSAVRDAARTETIPPDALSYIQTNLAKVTTPGLTDGNVTGRTRVIYVKLKLRQAFPMSFNEALLPYLVTGNAPLPPQLPASLAPLPGYVTYLSSLGITAPFTPPPTPPNPTWPLCESSVCLLMALQRGFSGVGVDMSALTAGGAIGNYTLPSGKTLPYLADAWGTPLYFSRFPTGSTILNPNGATISAPNPSNDPGDPDGYLNNSKWNAQAKQWYSELTLQALAPGTPAGAPALSYKLVPMIASAGPDGQWQTNPITFATTVAGGDDMFSTP
jgi:prepilin-type N-terminal cleavage/methylation domain-containing protein